MDKNKVVILNSYDLKDKVKEGRPIMENNSFYFILLKTSQCSFKPNIDILYDFLYASKNFYAPKRKLTFAFYVTY